MQWGQTKRFSNLSRFVTEIFHQFDLNQHEDWGRIVTQIFPDIDDKFHFLNVQEPASENPKANNS